MTKQIVFTFGRFNPPTTGHRRLVEKVEDIAKQTGAKPVVYASQSFDNKTNPLQFSEKIDLLRKLFPGVEVPIVPSVKSAFDAMDHIVSEGYKDVTIVVGSDRVDEFKRIFTNYIKEESDPGFDARKHYDINYKVVSAGKRNSISESISGTSGTKMRKYVTENDITSFLREFPSDNTNLARRTFQNIKRHLTETTVSEKIAIFVSGGPASGKDLIIRDLKETFHMKEVAPQDISGIVTQNLIVNGRPQDMPRAKLFLENLGYSTCFVNVVINDVSSRKRNTFRKRPLSEDKRKNKWKRYNLETKKLSESFSVSFVFDNSVSYKDNPEFIQEQLEQMKTTLNENLDNALRECLDNTSSPRKYQDALTEYCNIIDEETNPDNHDKQIIAKYVTEQTGISAALFMSWLTKNKNIIGLDEKYDLDYDINADFTSYLIEDCGAGEWGTPELTRRLKSETPGQKKKKPMKKKVVSESRKMYSDRRTAEKAAYEAAHQLNDVNASIVVIKHSDNTFSIHKDQYLDSKMKATDSMISSYRGKDVQDGVARDPGAAPLSFKEFSNS